MALEHVVSVKLVSDLKAQPGNADNIILTTGAITKGDGLGKLYYFDSSDNSSIEDMITYNILTPLSGGGRWKAVFSRSMVLPHGRLYINSGLKQFYYAGSSVAGSVSGNIYLTYDGTATGLPIFNQILYEGCSPNVNSSSSSDVVFAARQSLSADLKTLTYRLSRPNAPTLLNLSIITTGLTFNASRDVAVGTPYLVKVEGL